jgi:hypothetical protein
MDRESRSEQIGGSTIHVGDYVWTTIRYLDSPANYREYPPCQRRQPARPSAELVMLDAKEHSPWGTAFAIAAIALLTCVVLALITGLRS